MVNRRLKQEFAPIWEAAFGPNGAQQRRTVEAVLSPDNTVNPDALTDVLPWMVRDIDFHGAVATGDQWRRAMPQGAIIRHVAISAGTPPSGDSFVIHLTGGPDTVSFSLPAGQSTTATGATIPVPPGAFVGINVMRASGAENVTISLHYSAGTGGL